MKTSILKSPAPQWVLFNAEGQSIGRMSAYIAHILRGKHRPTFSPHQLCGDQVIVINASKLEISPVNLRRKVYHRHTGYTGHLKTQTLGDLMEKNPEKVIELAVRGMLRKNTLRDRLMERLHVFADADHPHAAQQPVSLSIPSR